MGKRIMAGGVAGLVLMVCVGVAGAGKKQWVPFKGSSENQAISAVPVGPEHVFVTTVGEGQATHLGRFTFISPHLSGLVDFSIDGTQTFTAANGDELHATLAGALTPVVVDGGLLLVGDVAGTITGGTGRFANATGQFKFSLVFDTATAHSFAEIDGVIHYAPGKGK